MYLRKQKELRRNTSEEFQRLGSPSPRYESSKVDTGLSGRLPCLQGPLSAYRPGARGPTPETPWIASATSRNAPTCVSRCFPSASPPPCQNRRPRRSPSSFPRCQTRSSERATVALFLLHSQLLLLSLSLSRRRWERQRPQPVRCNSFTNKPGLLNP